MPDAAVGAIAFVTLLTIMVGARGIRVARTPDDFMVAARQVPPALNAAAISGEYLSAASFLGIAGLVVAQGLGALWYSVGYTAGYLVLLLLVAAPLRRFGAYTIPDFAVGRLGSRGLRQTATALVLVIGWFYLLPQMKGAGITLQWVLGTPYWVGAATLGVVVSCNIAMGGMKGITFVQCFQYWLKLCAIGIPAIVLLIAAGHSSSPNLTPERAPVFTRATVVNMTQATSFTLTRSAEATVTGLLDQRTYRDQAVRPVRLPARRRRGHADRLRRWRSRPGQPGHGTVLERVVGFPVPDVEHERRAPPGGDVRRHHRYVLRRDRAPAHPGAVLHQPGRRGGQADDADRGLAAEQLLPVPDGARGADPVAGAPALPLQ